MRVILLTALLVLALVIFNVSAAPTEPVVFGTDNSNRSATNSKISVGSFNIQVFGSKKASKDSVMRVLVSTISQYDICLVMEIRDTSDTAIHKLVDLLNAAAKEQNEPPLRYCNF